MGLQQEIKSIEGNYGSTITIVGGKFTLRVEEGTKGAVPRKLTKGKNEGKEVWELHYPALSGMLVSVEVADSNFGGKDGTITLKDFKTGETFSIQTAADNGAFTNFLKSLPNIDTQKEVWLQMQPKKNGKLDANGNPLTDLRVLQDDHVVPNFYQEYDKQERKYVSINGMPDWEKTPKGWNHDEQDYFLWEKLEEFNETFVAPTEDPDFAPTLEEDVRQAVAEQSTPERPQIPAEEEEELDPIPF